jgi:hypothetical protein
MVLFQDLDDLNYPVGEYLEMVLAAQNADDLYLWDDKYKLQSELAVEEMEWLGVA